WQDFNEQIAEAWFTSRKEVPATKGEAGQLARVWFEKFYQRWSDLTGSPRDSYRELALDLYRRLRKLGVNIKPALDDQLEVGEPLPMPPPWVVDCATSERPVGTVLRVLAFGDEQRGPKLVVSVGRSPPPELLPWLKLPPYPRSNPG